MSGKTKHALCVHSVHTARAKFGSSHLILTVIEDDLYISYIAI